MSKFGGVPGAPGTPSTGASGQFTSGSRLGRVLADFGVASGEEMVESGCGPRARILEDDDRSGPSARGGSHSGPSARGGSHSGPSARGVEPHLLAACDQVGGNPCDDDVRDEETPPVLTPIVHVITTTPPHLTPEHVIEINDSDSDVDGDAPNLSPPPELDSPEEHIPPRLSPEYNIVPYEEELEEHREMELCELEDVIKHDHSYHTNRVPVQSFMAHEHLSPARNMAHGEISQCDQMSSPSAVDPLPCNKVLNFSQCSPGDIGKGKTDDSSLIGDNMQTIRMLRIEKRKLEERVEMLERKNALLYETVEKQRRERVTPNSAKSNRVTPRKAVKNFSKSCKSAQRYRCSRLNAYIESLIGTCTSPQEKLCEKSLLIEQYCKSVGINRSQLPRLTPEEDLMLTINCNLSFNQRKKLKRELEQKLITFFATTKSVERLRKTLCNGVEYDIRAEEHTRATAEKKTETKTVIVAELKDVQGALTRRIQTLSDAKKLHLGGKFNKKLWLCIVGDKGGTTTKLSLFIGNVAKPNSRRNLLLCGLFDAEDTGANLRKFLSTVCGQIDNLKNVTVNVDGVPVVIEIVMFQTADFKFTWAILGFKPGNHSYVCFKCYAQKVKIGEKERPAKPRTIESYLEDAKTGRYGVLKGVEPMFKNIPLERFIPCLMHIVSGMADLTFLAFAMEQAQKMDAKEAGVVPAVRTRTMSMSKETNLQLGEVEAMLEIAKEAEAQLLREHADMEATHDCLKAITTKSIVKCNETRCDNGDNCVVVHRSSTKLSMEVKRCVQCDVCQKWKHLCCELIFTKEDMEKKVDCPDDYVCMSCASGQPLKLRENMKHIRQQGKEVVREVTKARDYQEKLMKQHETLTAYKSEKTGAHMRELERRLNRAGADLRAFHQALTGNHIYNILRGDGPDIIFEIFEQFEDVSQEEVTIRKKLMKILATIQSFSSTKDLSGNERKELKEMLQDFEQLLAQVEGEHNRTPKLHSLLVHVPEYAEKYGSPGMMSEQGQESDHRGITTLTARYSSIRNKIMQTKLVLDEHNREMFINDAINEDVEWWIEESEDGEDENMDQNIGISEEDSMDVEETQASQ